MTRQTWTAFVSAFVFVGLAVLLVVVPVPFVSWSPGGTRDTLGNVGNEPIIKVQGIDTYPTTGRLDMTIVVDHPGGRPAQPAAGAAVVLAAEPRHAAPGRGVRAGQVGRAGRETRTPT